MRFDELAVTAAAVARATVLLQHDKLTEPLRHRWWQTHPQAGWMLDAGQAPGKLGDGHPASGWRPVPMGDQVRWLHEEGTKLGYLLVCPACLGVWLSAIAVLALEPRAALRPIRFVRDVLAVAATALAIRRAVVSSE